MRFSSRLLLLLLLPTILLAPALRGLDRQSSADYHNRRVRLSGALNQGIAVVFAADEPLTDFTPYRQDSDFYYLTGWNAPGAASKHRPSARTCTPSAATAKSSFSPPATHAPSATPAPSSTLPHPTPSRPPALPKSCP